MTSFANPILLAGPTGVGKSQIAVDLYQELHKRGIAAEIIAADSITHYQKFNIGSAKPTPGVLAKIPHHLIDICAPEKNFTAGDFVRAADKILTNLKEQKKIALIVGGSGFYLKAFLQGMAVGGTEDAIIKSETRKKLETELEQFGSAALYEEMLRLDPELATAIHPNDHYRIIRSLEAMRLHQKKWSELNREAEARPSRYPEAKFFCLHAERDYLRKRVEARTQAMLEQGLLAEVESLLQSGIAPTVKAFQSIGYRQCLEYLQVLPAKNPAKLPHNLEELRLYITQETMRLAKSQMTWLRGQVKSAIWLAIEENPLAQILQALGL